jgi:hypothetical protein
MTKKLDIVPKSVNYRVDGSGRDSFINFNNGGNIKSSNELGHFKYSNKKGVCFFNSGKPYNVLSKVTIYKSDGMGRDQYIVKDCGGFYKSGENYNSSFRTSLRNYNTKPTKVLQNDFSLLSKNHLLNSVKQKIEETTKKQRIQSARLSVPKKVVQKYNNINAIYA